MSDLKDFTNEEILALHVAVGAKAKKAAQKLMAPTGLDQTGRIKQSETGKMVVEIEYTLGRADDTKKWSTSATLNVLAMAMVMKRMGCTGPAAERLLVEAMKEVMDAGLSASAAKALKDETGINAAVARFQREVVEKLPKTPVMGKVVSTVTVRKVG